MDKKLIGVGIFCLVLGLLIASLFLVNRTTGEVRKVMTSGSATLSTSPDQASIYLGVRTDSLTADQARQENADQMQKVRKALADLNVAEKDIQTVYYYVNPRYNWENGRSEIIGYEAVQQISVKTTNLDGVGKLIDAAVKAGANEVNNIQFELSDQKKKQTSEELLAKATQDSQEKASILAKNLHAKIGKVLEISEANYNYRPYPIVYSMLKDSAAAENAPTEINPQEVEMSVSVQVSFSLR